MGPVNADQYSRLIVINNDQLSCCLLVGRLQGLRHFDPEVNICETGEMNQKWAGYIAGALGRDQQKWLVFDTDLLFEDKSFLTAAA